MSDKVKVVILGSGNIAHVHMDSCAKASNIEVKGTYDIVPERAEEAARQYGFKAYKSLDEVWADDEVRGVVIAVPNDRHDVLAIEAAKHHKYVFCEKPMTLTPERGKIMEDVCGENGVKLQMGFCNRFLSETETLMRYIQAGELGDIYMANTSMLRQRGMPIGWFSNKAKSGGGPLIDIGVHVIDVSWYLMGRPRPVAAKALNFNKVETRVPDNMVPYFAAEKDDVMNVEDSTHGLITFENGAGLMYEASWSINGADTESLRLFGSKGGASLWPLKVYRPEHNVMTEVSPFYQLVDCYQKELEHFGRVILGQEEPLSPARDGVTVQKMLCALYESAACGHEVEIR